MLGQSVDFPKPEPLTEHLFTKRQSLRDSRVSGRAHLVAFCADKSDEAKSATCTFAEALRPRCTICQRATADPDKSDGAKSATCGFALALRARCTICQGVAKADR